MMGNVFIYKITPRFNRGEAIATDVTKYVIATYNGFGHYGTKPFKRIEIDLQPKK